MCSVSNVRKWSNTLWPDCHIRLRLTLLHCHHHAGLFESGQVNYVECLSKIKWILSIIFHAIYEVVCIQLAHFSHDDWENMCTLFYYHHTVCHCLGLRHEMYVFLYPFRSETIIVFPLQHDNHSNAAQVSSIYMGLSWQIVQYYFGIIYSGRHMHFFNSIFFLSLISNFTNCELML